MKSNKKFRLLPDIIFPLIILLVAGFICFKNYSPGTYLIGWDSLHPEFNFPEAFRRIWEGVWRAEQGVGAIAAHSHMADFPRIIFLWLESFILPASFLRYSYIFLCLILGPLGVYFFLKYVFQKEKDSTWIYPAAFLGALFYLLNLSTLQNFYVPFEMFTAAFAFIPWIAFSGLKYLREGGKRGLVFWLAILILSSPMAYAATLWYASFAGLFLFFGAFTLISSAKKAKSKRLLIMILTSLLLNLYWILPNIYSVINQSGVISNSNINRLFSPEAFLRNRDSGNPADILLQKSFLFDWRNFDFAGNQFIDLMGVWQKYLSNSAVLNIGYILGGASLLGLFLGTIKREKTALALIPALIFCLFFLININPPTGALYAYLYSNFGFFAEGFRMPFTKFSILYEFLASFYFGYFVFLVLTIRSRLLVFFKFMFLEAIAIGLIYFMLPVFNGWLIGPNVRKTLPGEYQQVFNWFKSNPHGRIALIPINSKYGWEYRNWDLPAGRQGYEGSGFLTYGISNPIMYRDFDRWSAGNEDFYTQSAFALYSGNIQGYIDTLKKYRVEYILMDESIINPGGSSDILKITELKNIFAENGIGEVVGFGFLKVYETGYGGEEVSVPSKYIQTGLDLSYSPTDPQYADYGDYIGSGNVIPVRKTPNLPTVAPLLSENLSINRGFPDAYNCDLKKNGSVFKANSSRGILYRAENGGASCDYLGYPDLRYNQSYIVRVAGENNEGRSLKIYLFNEDFQVPDLEEILPSGRFDRTYFIYPRNVEGGGYVLNLETRSFGRIASENLLTKVEFYEATPAAAIKTQGEYGISNNLMIKSVQKYGTWGYKVDTDGSGLLQLGQGYEGGWKAFPTFNYQFSIFNFQSSINVPIFKQELEHVKVNSWSNGWVVPNCQNENSLKIANCKLIIVYWPQILEWVGGAFGVAAILLLLLSKKPNNLGG